MGSTNTVIERNPCNETILLAEDELMVRKLIVAILRQEGYAVLECSDGEEALQMAYQREGEKIDLLLSDIVMPRMSGIDLYQQFSSQYPGIPVLLMSGYANESIPRSVPFLPKPFGPTRLAEAVRAAIGQAPTQG